MHPSVIVLTKKIDNGILLLNDRGCAKKRRDRRDRGVRMAVIAFQERYTFAENIRGGIPAPSGQGAAAAEGAFVKNGRTERKNGKKFQFFRRQFYTHKQLRLLRKQETAA